MKLKQGRILVRISRDIVTTYLKKGRLKKIIGKRKDAQKKRGVFLTTRIVDVEKGVEKPIISVGYPFPLRSLYKTVMDSAINTAIRIRLHSLANKFEIEELAFEVSVLTALKLVQVSKPTEYLQKIRIGHDGLMINRGFLGGLLLPQVPLKERWKVEDFLSECCMRTGLTPDSWLTKNVDIYTFQTETFKENEPNGKIVRI